MWSFWGKKGWLEDKKRFAPVVGLWKRGPRHALATFRPSHTKFDRLRAPEIYSSAANPLRAEFRARAGSDYSVSLILSCYRRWKSLGLEETPKPSSSLLQNYFSGINYEYLAGYLLSVVKITVLIAKEMNFLTRYMNNYCFAKFWGRHGNH